MHELLTPQWVNQLALYQRILIAFSGGLDSTVLLHVLAGHPTLLKKLRAIHINHSISPNALIWQTHCQQICDAQGIPYEFHKVQFETKTNIEENARNARYHVLGSLMQLGDALVLAHHKDDQAETLLLRLFRGAGVNGLGAMKAIKKFRQGDLLRPFLDYPRQALEAYAYANQLQWIDDETNQDIRFSRNFLRHQLFPSLKNQWPTLINQLAHTATHCQEAQANLEDLACLDCPELEERAPILSIYSLKSLNFTRLKNVVRTWLKLNGAALPNSATLTRLIHEVLYAKQDSTPSLEWGEYLVKRFCNRLYLMKNEKNPPPALLKWSLFPEPLELGNGGYLSARLMEHEGLFLSPNSEIEVRFRQGGETFFWHKQTKALKKLFQLWQIPPWLRDQIPLVYVNNQLAAVVGYAISDNFYIDSGGYQLELRVPTTSQ